MELVILVGAPGSGKTSFYRLRFAGTHQQVSYDAFPNTRKKETRQRQLIASALAAGHSVVVDNTNATIADRAPLIVLGKSCGAACIGYYFDVSTRACVARNRDRPANIRVPPVAIFATAKRMQPPSYAEGFDQLFRISLNDAREFEVEAVPPGGTS